MCDYKCSKCGSDHHEGCGVGSTTLMYFEPIYKNGENINPDRNTTEYNIECLDCGNKEKVVK